MTKLVKLSDYSKKLILEHYQSLNNSQLNLWSKEINRPIPVSTLVTWLAEGIAAPEQPTSLPLELLRANLLEDLYKTYFKDPEDAQGDQTEQLDWSKKSLFSLLTYAGTLVAVCQGFDGIVSILSSFTTIPVTVMFAMGVVFAVLTVAIFYGFELLEISRQVGVPITKSGQLLDIFLNQVELINKFQRRIAGVYTDVTLDDLVEYKQIVDMLKSRYSQMDSAREYYKHGFYNPYLVIARGVIAAMTALIYFSGGFFAAQTLALTVATLMLGASATAASLPVVFASTLVGFAAAIVYWFVQRPSMENLVGHCVGYDKENIEAFSNPKDVADLKRELGQLGSHIEKEEKEEKKKKKEQTKTSDTKEFLKINPNTTLEAHKGHYYLFFLTTTKLPRRHSDINVKEQRTATIFP